MANIKELIQSIESTDSSFDEKLEAINKMEETLVALRQQEETAVQDNVDLIVEAIKVMENKVTAQLEVAKSIVPEKGDKGDKGDKGADGRQGIDGKNGQNGTDGKDGEDGKDGVSVRDAKIDFDGSLVITLSTGQEINVGEVVAPDLAEKIKVISTMSTNGAVAILDEGTSITSGVKKINFVGATVTATNSGDDVTVNVSAGTGTVTSVAATVPSFLSVAGSPITTTGTLAITLSGTALPVVNGGTGVTTSTGSGNVVLSTSPTLTTPDLGTPSSGTVTNLTGTASININGTVGATTANTGAFTTLSATGVTTVQTGTAALPAITTTGDTNTGIFFPAADTIAFAEGGAEAMRITSAGNVGIGTTNPAALLSVSGTLGVSEPGGAGGRLQITSSGNGAVIFQNDNSPIIFKTVTGTQEKMCITDGGSVGIGTTSPDSSNKLEVAGDISLSWNANKFIGMKYFAGASYKMGLMLNDATRECKVWSQSSESDDKITFYTGSTPSERMRVTDAGGVSFGSTGTAYGTLGQVLTSAGNAPPTWTTAASGTVTSVAATVPSFLSVTGSPITTSGTLAITLSGTALPIANGGTGATTLAGASIATYSGTETLTNKRIDPRVTSAASASSLTPDISASDVYAFTALAAGLTINAPTGTPLDGDKLIFRLLDNGTSRALTWNATYTVIGVTLPTATTISKTTYVGCIYNANNTRWDVIAVTTQA